MLGKISRYSLYSVAALGLVSAASLTLTQSGQTVANSHSGVQTLSCIGQLGDPANHDGMNVNYNSPKNTVIVNFMTRLGATSASRGHCVINGTPWKSTTYGKFCHFGVNDVIYKKNKSSMNIISAQAPYLLKIIKTGQAFSLRVRSGDSRCPNGLTVVN